MTDTKNTIEMLSNVLLTQDPQDKQSTLSKTDTKAYHTGRGALLSLSEPVQKYQRKWAQLNSRKDVSTEHRVQQKIEDTADLVRLVAKAKGIDPAIVEDGLAEVPLQAKSSSKQYIHNVRITFRSAGMMEFDAALADLEDAASEGDGFRLNF